MKQETPTQRSLVTSACTVHRRSLTLGLHVRGKGAQKIQHHFCNRMLISFPLSRTGTPLLHQANLAACFNMLDPHVEAVSSPNCVLCNSLSPALA